MRREMDTLMIKVILPSGIGRKGLQ